MGRRRQEGARKAIKAAVKYASECEPLVRTIQGGLETCDMKRAIGDITKTVDDVEDLVSKISDVAAKAIQFVPSMQIVGKSFADSAKIFASFSSIASAAGIGVNIVLAYQGLSAVRLIDARFPQYVYDMISERVTQTSLDPNQDHWFFVYHPDNDWYPGFYRIMHDKPIGPAFCGYTNQIDTAFVFMLAARRRIEKKERRAQKEGRPIRPTKLHLLIPAYQPILILEALQIPEEIGDFVMEGRINSNREFVWLSLPEQQRRYVQDIGHFAPPTQGFRVGHVGTRARGCTA
ncbi:unnamed protein product [Parascedosporium putredinis]|uniref:Uncharacterized protein n=1 Tax=Parascedosporium putredinis TaxID=1442378 RepID=A0A9P1H1Q2_9PEZI|nr:unnamed protein product [Parascedosporium putredinis]CAI7994002.1 unnamed protein product [Parascedosporium putredinis]